MSTIRRRRLSREGHIGLKLVARGKAGQEDDREFRNDKLVRVLMLAQLMGIAAHGKRVPFDDDTWDAIKAVAKETGSTFPGACGTSFR